MLYFFCKLDELVHFCVTNDIVLSTVSRNLETKFQELRSKQELDNELD